MKANKVTFVQKKKAKSYNVTAQAGIITATNLSLFKKKKKKRNETKSKNKQ